MRQRWWTCSAAPACNTSTGSRHGTGRESLCRFFLFLSSSSFFFSSVCMCVCNLYACWCGLNWKWRFRPLWKSEAQEGKTLLELLQIEKKNGVTHWSSRYNNKEANRCKNRRWERWKKGGKMNTPTAQWQPEIGFLCCWCCCGGLLHATQSHPVQVASHKGGSFKQTLNAVPVAPHIVSTIS